MLMGAGVDREGERLNRKILRQIEKQQKWENLFDLKRGWKPAVALRSPEQLFFDSLTNCSFQQLANEFQTPKSPVRINF